LHGADFGSHLEASHREWGFALYLKVYPELNFASAPRLRHGGRGKQREPAKSYIRHNHIGGKHQETTRRSVIRSNFVALSGAAVPDSSPLKLGGPSGP
jgi:hypothetical protein